MDQHSVLVRRPRLSSTDQISGKRTRTMEQVSAALSCLVEPLGGKIKEEAMLKWPEAKKQLTWRESTGVVLQAGDLVTYKSSIYEVQNIIDDTDRGSSLIEPFYTCFLLSTD